jgi:voltage-gated potassium channel
VAAEGDMASRVFDVFIMSLIVLNVIAVIIETEAKVQARIGRALHWFDVVSVIVFTIEYILRVWSCTSEERYRRPILGRLRFAVSPLAIVDLLAILPFYIPFMVRLDLRFLRALRLFRLFRIFKMGRYSESMKILGNVLRDKKAMLLVTLFVVFILLIVASSLLYFIENPEQPEKFSSIPATMWWGVETLTTVGYGDVVPITGWGKLMGAVIAFLGVGLFALPAGILAQGFTQEIAKKKGEYCCPHCGKDLRG